MKRRRRQEAQTEVCLEIDNPRSLEIPPVAEVLDLPDEHAVPDHQMTHVERINGAGNTGVKP